MHEHLKISELRLAHNMTLGDVLHCVKQRSKTQHVAGIELASIPAYVVNVVSLHLAKNLAQENIVSSLVLK